MKEPPNHVDTISAWLDRFFGSAQDPEPVQTAHLWLFTTFYHVCHLLASLNPNPLLYYSIVALIVSLLTPTIRSQLLSVIPFELGLLVHTLPCPFAIRGQFHIYGLDISMLGLDWHKADLLAKMAGYSPMQMEMFYWMQKAIDRYVASCCGSCRVETDGDGDGGGGAPSLATAMYMVAYAPSIACRAGTTCPLRGDAVPAW
jgi:hypothetical protein